MNAADLFRPPSNLGSPPPATHLTPPTQSTGAMGDAGGGGISLEQKVPRHLADSVEKGVFYIQEDKPYEIDRASPQDVTQIDWNCKDQYLSMRGNQISPVVEQTYIENGEDFDRKCTMYPGPIIDFVPKGGVGRVEMHHYMRHHLVRYTETDEMSKFIFLKNCVISYSPYAGQPKLNAGNKGIQGGPASGTMYMGNYVYLGIEKHLYESIIGQAKQSELFAIGVEMASDSKQSAMESKYTWPLAKIPTNKYDQPFEISVIQDRRYKADGVELMKKWECSFMGDAIIQVRSVVMKTIGNQNDPKFKPHIDIQLHTFVCHGKSDEAIGQQVTASLAHASQMSADLFQEVAHMLK